MASQTKETLRKLIPGSKAKDSASTHPSTAYEVGLVNLFTASSKEHKEHKDLKDAKEHKETKESKESRKKAEKEEEKNAKEIAQRLKDQQWKNITESQVRYALRHRTVMGNPANAVLLLEVFRETMEGIVYPPNTRTALVGAENRQAVTCYLDATLFAMFARSRSYEYILFRQYPDQRRQRLSNMLRLWVNMLRRGFLIQTDITEQLQEAISETGWPDARTLRQQDASEAFSFIADSLELPSTTVKTDLFHVGKELQEDHKFVQERLFTVCIPPVEGDNFVRIEDLLVGHFFNNKIQVKRPLQRRSTMRSIRSIGDKNQIVHIEVVESAPKSATPGLTASKSLEHLGQTRSTGVFGLWKPTPHTTERKSHDDFLINLRKRANTFRREDNTNAWQHSTVIPHFTEPGPSGATEMAAYYAQRRPTIGVCLKRYAMDSNGHAVRLNTKVKISLEIEHPEFIADDQVDGQSLEFKLVLHSVVCHRATSATNSIESGHYVSLVRGELQNAPSAPNTEAQTGGDSTQIQHPRWMLFDDLAAERVVNVDVLDRLERETPYLLFYEIVPLNEDPRGDPPSYEEIHNTWPQDIKSDFAFTGSIDRPHTPDDTTVKSLELASPPSTTTSPRLNAVDAPSVPRVSVEFSREVSRTTSATDDKSAERRGRHSMSSIPRSDLQLTEGNFGASGGSLALALGSSASGNNLASTGSSLSAATSLRGTSAPTTPGEEMESKGGLFGIGRRRSRREPNGGSAARKSRPTSQVGDISRWFDNLVKKHSTEEIVGTNGAAVGPGVPVSIPEDSELAKKLSLLHEEGENTADDTGHKSPEVGKKSIEVGKKSAEVILDGDHGAENGIGLAVNEDKSGVPQRKSSVFNSLRRAVKARKDKEKEKEADKSRERSKSRNRLGLGGE